MFESLSDRLQAVFQKLGGKGKLTEDDVREAMKQVRLALLEADVNFKVVKDFVAKVTEKAIGEEVTKSLTPAQQVVKIVNDELIDLLGKANVPLVEAKPGPTVLMMAGLQGSGKTTLSAKLALYLRKKGKRPLLVAADVYRPAAIAQLESDLNQSLRRKPSPLATNSLFSPVVDSPEPLSMSQRQMIAVAMNEIAIGKM